jgi:hypothetical protein
LADPSSVSSHWCFSLAMDGRQDLTIIGCDKRRKVSVQRLLCRCTNSPLSFLYFIGRGCTWSMESSSLHGQKQELRPGYAPSISEKHIFRDRHVWT